ncbi:MAG: hypothetical protein ACI97A_001660 [Planctomycetota bacterium]|jgi:hypothetical protein
MVSRVFLCLAIRVFYLVAIVWLDVSLLELSDTLIVTVCPLGGATKQMVAVCLDESKVILSFTPAPDASASAENPPPTFVAVMQTVEPASTPLGPLSEIILIRLRLPG